MYYSSRDQHGFTPLHYACAYGHIGIVDYLLGRGARNDIVNMGGDSALHMAAANGKYDAVVSVREREREREREGGREGGRE